MPSVLQRLVDGLAETGRKIVVCGSSQRMMQGFVLKANEPLYGRAAEILPIRPLPFGWLKRAFPKASAVERLRMWGAWGGVPRYWELQQRSKTLVEALKANLSPLGVLRHEPEFLLMDEVGDVAQASAVLAFIGEGAHRVSEIAGRMGRSATDLSRPLRRLTELELITREQPFGTDAHGKKSLYRIADPFLDFWFTFVRPRWSQEAFLDTKEDLARFEQAYQVHLGGVWERLVRETLARRPLPGSDVRWRNVSRWWGAGRDRQPMELDIVAESEDGKTLLVGEAKLTLGAAEASRCRAALEAKASQLPFASKYERVRTELFVAARPPKGAISQDWCESVSDEAHAKPGRGGVPPPSAADDGTPALPRLSGFARVSDENTANLRGACRSATGKRCNNLSVPVARGASAPPETSPCWLKLAAFVTDDAVAEKS